MSCRVPNKYKEDYIGQMPQALADTVLSVREMKKVDALKGSIFDFPDELIAESIEKKRSIRSLLAERKENMLQYLGELRDYQTVGTAFMYMSYKSIIADGCGLGKTAELGALLNYLHLKKEMTRALVVVDNSALYQMQEELIKFTGLNVVALETLQYKLKNQLKKTDWSKVNIIVIKHSMLKSDTFNLFVADNINENGRCNIYDTFILDESSVIKNDTSKTYEYTKNLCDLAKRVHFLNATAFETKLYDIYYQLDMMDERLLPTKNYINHNYCEMETNTFWRKGKDGQAKQGTGYSLASYKNEDKFREALKVVYFGRSAEQVGFNVPHIYKTYEIEPSEKQAKCCYNDGRYDRILNCPSLLPELGIPTDIKSVPKIARLVSLMENEFNELPTMIYCFHLEAQRAIYDELKKIGRKPVIRNGELSEKEKNEARIGFNNGTYDVIILNTKKSLNLNTGKVCIFYSVDPNPAGMFQTANRIDRKVNDDIKTFVLLLYKDTQEYNYFRNVVAQRAKNSRALTIDTKTVVDYFFEDMGA